MPQVWKPVVGYEKLYEVSDRGKVRSLERMVLCVVRFGNPRWGKSRMNRVPAKLLKTNTLKSGHKMVRLYKHGGGRSGAKDFAVHRLVLEAFVGPCPQGKQACHEDGDPSNNRLANLRWDTPKSNQADRDRHGRTRRGSKSGMAKLKEHDIPDIRRRLARGESMNSVGIKYGVDVATIRDIKVGRTWAHVL